MGDDRSHCRPRVDLIEIFGLPDWCARGLDEPDRLADRLASPPAAHRVHEGAYRGNEQDERNDQSH